jgi:hypothetical protein
VLYDDGRVRHYRAHGLHKDESLRAVLGGKILAGRLTFAFRVGEQTTMLAVARFKAKSLFQL